MCSSDLESARAILKKAEVLAVTPCTCRLIARKCEHPVEACLQVDNAARYTLDRGTGRRVDLAEALAILEACRKQGLVQITMNKAHAGHFICNCCGCCCQALPLIRKERLKLADPSRFTAAINHLACSGCQSCETRCPFDAISMVDGLAEVTPSHCMGCGLCVSICPESAISLQETRQAHFIPGAAAP